MAKSPARWLVQLLGDRFDLEEFPRWFPSGDVFAIEKEREFFITGEALETLRDARAVREEAARRVDEFAAIILLLCSNLRKPQVGNVFREHEDGRRDITVFLQPITARAKLGGLLVYVGDKPSRPTATQAQNLLSVFRRSPHLLAAVQLWGDPARSWPALYRAVKEIEAYLGKPIHKAGLCSHGERKRFTGTANSAEAVGLGARHAQGEFKPPAHPLGLSEGAAFVERLLRAIGQREGS